MNTDDYKGHTIDKMTHSQAGETLWFLEHGSNCMTMNRATLDLILAAPDLLKEVKQLRVEAAYYRRIIFRYRHHLEYLRYNLNIYARFGDFDDLTQREEEELKHLSVWERTKMTLTTMVSGINQLLEEEE